VHNRNHLSKSILFLALAGVSGAALAAEAGSAAPAPEVFVKSAAQDGMTEVELGKVALDKSQDPAVRNFAQRMVTDHTKANSELATIAAGKGIDAPKTLDAEHQAMVNTLKQKSGAEFDAEYSRHMNMDHNKAVALFESGSKSSDKDLAGFASKTLPTLKEHKKLAQKLPGNGNGKG
jgi:putative membrane protein